MQKKTKVKTLLALMCCGLMAVTGPASPLAAFAAVDDVIETDDLPEDSVYGPVGDPDSSPDDSAGYPADDSAADPVDEPTTPASNNTALDTLYNQRDALQSNINDLKEKEKQLQSSLSNTKGEKERAVVARDNLAYEITLKSQIITSLEMQIENLDEEITLREENIVDKQAEIDYNYELLKKRLSAMYMEDDGTTLGLLLGSDSFAEFLTRSEYMVRIAEHDRNLMQNLTVERVAIEAEKASLEDAKAKEEENKVEIEAQKKALGLKHNEASLQVQDIDRMQQEYLADLAKNKALQDAEVAKLNSVFQQIEWSKNPYVGGVMLWPLPGFYTVSSNYGSRFGGNDFHTGMDITGSGCFGSTIVAANDGTVKMVNTSYTNGVGYGIYLIIDHGVNDNGGSVATLYGHCSSILVSVGQEVKRGDPIANVGSTGWSTGPHLHFEVRIGGSAVNPAGYVSG